MLKKIRSLTYKYAIPAALIVYALIELLLFVLGRLLSSLPATLPIAYLNEFILIIVPIAIVIFFGFSRAFKKGSFLRGLYYGLPYLLWKAVGLIIFFAGTLGNPNVNWKPWYMIIYGVVSIIGVGLREECIYRATIQNIVAKKHANSVKGIWISVTIGAIIFGLTHISNLYYGMDPSSVLIQVLSATAIGFVFGAIYLRSGSIWALIFIHTFTDIAGLASSTFLKGISDIEDMNKLSWSWSRLILWIIYIGFAAFLLRPSKCKQIYENLCFTDEKSEEAERT